MKWSREQARARYVALVITGVLSVVRADGFTPNDTEEELAALIISHPNQQRPFMQYDPILSMAARSKAKDMARPGYASHTDPDGYGPNKAVELAGYQLPDWWPAELDSNLVESLAYGDYSAEQAFDSFLESSTHRHHVLAEDAFFENQTRYGIGYTESADSVHGRYYVILTAPPSDAPNGTLEPYLEWLFCRYALKEIATFDDAVDRDGDGLSEIVEFSLDTDPNAPDSLPTPEYAEDADLIEWLIPLRAYLGSIQVDLQFSKDMRTWSSFSTLRRDSDRFVVSRAGRLRFLRLMVER